MTWRACAALLALAGAVAATPAFAAGLGVSTDRLTTVTQPTSIAPTECTLSATADADIDGLLNSGTATTLRVRSSSVGNRRALVRFGLAACAMPAGAAIRTGSLRLVLVTAPGSSRLHEARRVTTAWTETNVTAANAPSVAGTATATASTGTTAGTTLAWDVRADVEAMHAGTAANHGWRLNDQAEGATSAVEAAFASREHATASSRPTLRIEYYP